jgi:GTPase SAR1 family protein
MILYKLVVLGDSDVGKTDLTIQVPSSPPTFLSLDRLT